MNGKELPKQLFSAASFTTLGGCALVTWIVSGVVSGVIKADPKLIGLIVAIIVSYAAVIISRQKQLEQYVVAFFNGFLIYAAVAGGTSYLPYLNKETAGAAQEPQVNVKSALTTPWVKDLNLVRATRNLIGVNTLQAQALDSVSQGLEQLRAEPAMLEPATAPGRARLEKYVTHFQAKALDVRQAIAPLMDSLSAVGLKFPKPEGQ